MVNTALQRCFLSPNLTTGEEAARGQTAPVSRLIQHGNIAPEVLARMRANLFKNTNRLLIQTLTVY